MEGGYKGLKVKGAERLEWTGWWCDCWNEDDLTAICSTTRIIPPSDVGRIESSKKIAFRSCSSHEAALFYISIPTPASCSEGSETSEY